MYFFQIIAKYLKHLNMSVNTSNYNKNKKKKNFLKHAKAHAKQGKYGLGVELKEDEYNHFITISEQLKTVSGADKGKYHTVVYYIILLDQIKIGLCIILILFNNCIYSTIV